MHNTGKKGEVHVRRDLGVPRRALGETDDAGVVLGAAAVVEQVVLLEAKHRHLSGFLLARHPVQSRSPEACPRSVRLFI